MFDLWFQVTVILALTLFNAVFAMSEIAVISSRKARLRQRADDGDRGARVALELVENPDRFLSTIQVGITLIGVVSGAFGGATMAGQVGDLFREIEWLSAWADAIGFVLVVVLIAFLTLLLGELVPKRVALLNPEAIASHVARPMRGLSRLAGPAVTLLSQSTGLILRSMRLRDVVAPPVTQEEISIMIEQGQQAGIFEKVERELVERVFRLGDRHVSAVMTPRTEIVWVDVEEPIGDVMRAMTSAPHTYYPVCRGSVEHVVGMVSVKDQWVRMVNKQPPDIKATLMPPLFVPENVPALRLLEQFKQAGRHVALVVDEYGSVSGLVTLNDVLEAIVGDIPASNRPEDQDAVQRPDGSWLFDGGITIDRVMELCRIDEVPPEDEGLYDTLAGMLMARLGRIPRVGDTLTWLEAKFEVVDMDGHRVDKVLVYPPPPEPTSGSAEALAP
ncbi:MAG: HlyC/CorC family transporter [Planctomycetia bacterium]|nr:MAG: HlyC/CorC family transporter [Planctomycetia bacterium]